MNAGITSFWSRSTRNRSARFRCPPPRAKNALRTSASTSASGSAKRFPKGSSPKGSPGRVGGWGGGWASRAAAVPKRSSPANSAGGRIIGGIVESLPLWSREPKNRGPRTVHCIVTKRRSPFLRDRVELPEDARRFAATGRMFAKGFRCDPGVPGQRRPYELPLGSLYLPEQIARRPGTARSRCRGGGGPGREGSGATPSFPTRAATSTTSSTGSSGTAGPPAGVRFPVFTTILSGWSPSSARMAWRPMRSYPEGPSSSGTQLSCRASPRVFDLEVGRVAGGGELPVAGVRPLAVPIRRLERGEERRLQVQNRSAPGGSGGAGAKRRPLRVEMEEHVLGRDGPGHFGVLE